MQMSDAKCSICGVAFTREEVVPLIGTPDQVQTQHDMLTQRQQQREKREDKKKKKRKSEPSPETSGVVDTTIVAKRRL